MKLSFLFITILSFPALVSAQVFRPQKLSPEDQQKILEAYSQKISQNDFDLAVKLFKLDLASKVKILDRNITTFNYRKADEIGFQKNEKRVVNPEKAIDVAREWAAASKAISSGESGFMGWGYYSAKDPFVSMSYGGEDAVLTTLTYSKGAKMLDVTGGFINRFPMSHETADAFLRLCKKGDVTCQEAIKGAKMIGGIDKVDGLNQSPLLVKAYVQALEELGIQGLMYKWDTKPMSICDDEKNKVAFVHINAPMNQATMTVFSDISDSEKKQILKDPELLKKHKKLSVLMDTRGSKSTDFNWRSDISVTPEERKQFEEEWKSELYGCETSKAAKDGPTHNPEYVWQVMMQDGLLNLDLGKELNKKILDCVEQF